MGLFMGLWGRGWYASTAPFRGCVRIPITRPTIKDLICYRLCLARNKQTPDTVAKQKSSPCDYGYGVTKALLLLPHIRGYGAGDGTHPHNQSLSPRQQANSGAVPHNHITNKKSVLLGNKVVLEEEKRGYLCQMSLDAKHLP